MVVGRCEGGGVGGVCVWGGGFVGQGRQSWKETIFPGLQPCKEAGKDHGQSQQTPNVGLTFS